MKRPAFSDEVAPVIAFLCSDASRWVSAGGRRAGLDLHLTGDRRVVMATQVFDITVGGRCGPGRCMCHGHCPDTGATAATNES